MEYARKDGSTGWTAKITLLSWAYAPTNKPKEDGASNNNGDIPADEGGFVPTEDCGENGLPFN